MSELPICLASSVYYKSYDYIDAFQRQQLELLGLRKQYIGIKTRRSLKESCTWTHKTWTGVGPSTTKVLRERIEVFPVIVGAILSGLSYQNLVTFELNMMTTVGFSICVAWPLSIKSDHTITT